MSQYETEDVTKEITVTSEVSNEKGLSGYVKRNKVTVIIVIIIILIAIWYFFIRKKNVGLSKNGSASKALNSNVASSSGHQTSFVKMRSTGSNSLY